MCVSGINMCAVIMTFNHPAWSLLGDGRGTFCYHCMILVLEKHKSMVIPWQYMYTIRNCGNDVTMLQLYDPAGTYAGII